ncbi:hypothetical protein ABZV58_13520 [Nocardia sp. NPDC004654]|uniref:hypothetical protein n=2 Tax=unclassified Nocardia TaxID=2637762 RepID=UPI00339F6D34
MSTTADESARRVLDAALAEFVALRNELDEIGRGQRTVMNLNISVTTAIAAFVLSQRVAPQLLLVIPYVSVALGLLYQTYTIHAQHMGEYINGRLRPVITEKCEDARVFGWENYIRTTVYQTGWSQAPMRMAFALIIPIVPLVGLIWAIPSMNFAWHWLAWSGGALLYLGQLVSWVLLSRKFLWV